MTSTRRLPSSVATPSTPLSFPELEGSSSWGSHYSSRSQGRGRSRRRQDQEKTPSSIGTMRARSADARPQYDRSWEEGGVATRSCTAMFFPPQESRAVVTPSPLYSPTRYGGSANFAMHEEDGLLYDAMGIPQSTHEEYGRTTERRSLSPAAPMIRQSRSTDSGGRNNNSRRSAQQQYQLESHASWQNHHQPQQHSSPYYPHEPTIPVQQQNHTYNWSTHEPRALGVTDYEHLKASLIMFGDAHADQVSVYTGMSQQELLEKKRKDQTSKRRKDKKYGKQKKKKNDRILNLPSSLREFTSSSTSLYPQSVKPTDRSAQHYPQQQQRATAITQPSQGRTGLRSSLVRKREQARSQADKSNMGLWNIIPTVSGSRSRSASPPLKSPGSAEELLPTASSYESEERLGIEIHSDIDNTINTRCFDRPINRESPLVTHEELPTQWEQQIPLEANPTVVDDDFEEMTRLEATLAKKIPKQRDFVPTLSSSASVYVRKTRDAEVESVGDGYGMYFDDSSAPQSSRVRFSEHVKTKTLDDLSQPLNGVSPTSVMAMKDNSLQEINPSSSSDLAVDRALPQPRRIMQNDNENSLPFDEGRQSPYSSIMSSEKPKSILRKGRSTRSDTSSTTDWQSVVTASSRSENSGRISHAASAVPAEGFEYTRSVTKSPPSTGFLDTDGSEISPIVISGSLGDYDVHPRAGTDKSETDNWQKEEKSARKNIPNLYQQPFLEERGPRDDDSGVISEAYSEFITAVASVVLQTAVRQFLAKCRMRKLRNAAANAKRLERDRMKKVAVVLQKESEVDVPDARVYRENRSVVLASAKSSPRRAETAVETAQRKLDMQARAYELAAVRIQAFFRGWWVRDYIAVDNFCAKIIQKSFRGFRCRSNYNFDLIRIILVQSIARKKIARNECLIHMFSVVAIQAAFRAFLVRRSLALMHEQVKADRLMADSSLYNEAATKIQAQWRSYAGEMNYLRCYEDIVMVQALVRGMITRRLLQAWLKAHNIRLKSSHLRTHDVSSKRNSNRTLEPRSKGVHTESVQPQFARTAQQLQGNEVKDQTSIIGNGRVLMRYSEAGGQYHGIGTQGQNARAAGHKRETLSYSASSEEEKSSKDMAPRSTSIANDVEMRRKELSAIAKRREEEMRENERVVRRNDLVAITKRKEEEKRRKAVGSMVAAGEEEQRKYDGAVPTSKHDEQLRKGIAALAAQQEPKRRKEKRINDLAQLFARQEERKHPAPIQPVLQQSAQPPTNSRSVEGTKPQLATACKEESVVSYDRSEQRRKERIAYHRYAEVASKKLERVSQSLQIKEQGEPESFDSSKIEEASQVDLTDSYESRVNSNGAFEHLPPVEKERSGMLPPSTASETPRARKSGLFSPSAASQMLPTRTVTPVEKERSETGAQSAASARSPYRDAPAVDVERAVSEIPPERKVAPIQRDGAGMGKPSSASQIASDQNQTVGASNATASMKRAPILPPKKYNPFQSQRTEEEQSRIDKIHGTFLRVGLMARAANVRVGAAPVPKVTAPALKTNSKLSNLPDEESSNSPRPDQEASASDLIRAWRGRDQTQPKMQGKLF